VTHAFEDIKISTYVTDLYWVYVHPLLLCTVSWGQRNCDPVRHNDS